MENELIVIKKSYKEPETGDVFALQPKEGVYYYGKVIRSKVESKNIMFKGWYLVFIFNIKTNQIQADVNINNVPLLIRPMVVNKRPWTMGYFKTINNTPITDYDCSIDYGFWDIIKKRYYNLSGYE
ncbi:immunity 26/phosphotriesterase HocA family protein, partial [Chloroflexota bacterium]